MSLKKSDALRWASAQHAKRWTKYSHAADKSLCQRTRYTVYIKGMDEDVLPTVCARDAVFQPCDSAATERQNLPDRMQRS